jgi:outer membrane immunogenic protein
MHHERQQRIVTGHPVRAILATACLALGLLLSPWAARAQDVDWSGYYAGAHVGWLWADIDYREPDFPGFEINPGIDGFQGGLIAGYNHQINRLVLGLALDGGLQTASLDAGDPGSNGYSAFDLDWNAHFRARLGYALPRRTLVFAALGLAMARFNLDDVDPGFGKDNTVLTGWTLGGGIEHVLSDRLLLRLEYLYDDYGHANYRITSPPATAFFPYYRVRTELTASTLRAAIIWRF